METFNYLEEMDEWAARVEARHNFPDDGDDLNTGEFHSCKPDIFEQTYELEGAE